MADEAQQTQETTSPPGTEPLGNSEAARNPDGSIKDTQAKQTPDQSSEQKTEQKTEDKKTETKAETKADDKKAAPHGAPEKYETFKAPEGYEVDEKFAEEMTPIFKELNLSQEGAQRLVDAYSAKVLALAEEPYKAFEALRGDWRKAAAGDKDIGNGADGLKPEVSQTISRTIDAMPPKVAADFREALTITGAGDNPAVVKAFYHLAKQLSEGTLVRGGGPSPGGQRKEGAIPTAAQAFYPNLPSGA